MIAEPGKLNSKIRSGIVGLWKTKVEPLCHPSVIEHLTDKFTD